MSIRLNRLPLLISTTTVYILQDLAKAHQHIECLC